MGDNFRAALVALSRALPLVLFQAGIFVAGGFMVIILFGILFFAFRPAGGASQVLAIVVTMLVIMSVWIIGLVLQRFFLFRQRAAMLLLFSGCSIPAPALSMASKEAGRFFPDFSGWAVIKRSLGLALSAFYRGSGEFPILPAMTSGGHFSRILDLLATGSISQAILVLAFSRGGTDLGQSVQESLALYFQHGNESRRLARQWFWFSTAGMVFIFLCLALPNWFFFKSAGAPVWIGIVLAAAIAWLLNKAFIVPFVLAGLSGRLLTETRGKTPDPALCEKLSSLFPAAASTR